MNIRKFALIVWASLLAVSAYGTTLNPVQLLNPVGSTSGQAIVSTGASTAPAWGNVSATSLAAQAANTVIGNATGSSASPTAITVTGCNGAAQALQWTNGSGFGCNSAIATSGANSNITSLNSPALGAATATTASATTNTTQVATTAMVNSAITGGSLAGSFSTLTASGLISPTSTVGIQGTTTNDNANAGSVGEYICAQVTVGRSPSGCATNSNTPVSLTSGTTANITSISLTAGDWQVCGLVGSDPAGTTTQSGLIGSITTTSATIPTSPNGGAYVSVLYATTAAGVFVTAPVGCMRQLLSSTTTIYLVINSTFAVSTNAAYGFIWARRVR